mmetsp:Transcript_76378/g.212176  ORF Transcript_76378/g.212176 Transcript_76378/m.212176 type:complete len:308 (-) Transcript_76378:45-968(-)|eukprot:CAMPEP_0117537002 /NCGR_PEP_ID=MMETSP0784-20121206/41740_1 /TAXON_ID=39447 /ORGANISM="" /LENGTH=307 /DNA_ID=CAMNT_0005333575 /DNA_START=61 /DNA_END=984 /DNA_ORIENTATION=-
MVAESAASRRPVLPPIYRRVQRHYDTVLAEDRSSRDECVAALEARQVEVSGSCALEATTRRAQGERDAEAVTKASEERVKALEQERSAQLQKHRLDLFAVEEAIRRNRAEAEERLQQVEKDTMALHAAGDAEVARINAERDAAVRAARERQALADEAGEERSRRCERHERSVAAETKAAIGESEATLRRRTTEVDKTVEKWLAHFEGQTKHAMRRVSERITALLQEVRATRGMLLENRTCADGHTDFKIQTYRAEIAGLRQSVLDELAEARSSLKRVEIARASASCGQAGKPSKTVGGRNLRMARVS